MAGAAIEVFASAIQALEAHSVNYRVPSTATERAVVKVGALQMGPVGAHSALWALLAKSAAPGLGPSWRISHVGARTEEYAVRQVHASASATTLESLVNTNAPEGRVGPHVALLDRVPREVVAVASTTSPTASSREPLAIHANLVTSAHTAGVSVGPTFASPQESNVFAAHSSQVRTAIHRALATTLYPPCKRKFALAVAPVKTVHTETAPAFVTLDGMGTTAQTNVQQKLAEKTTA